MDKKLIDRPNFLEKPRKRNPLVKVLRTDEYFRQRIEKSAKSYTRKEKYRAW